MTKISILISFDLQQSLLKEIESVSPELIVQKSKNEKTLLHLAKNIDILFAGFFSRELFLAARNLKWIQTTGAGVDRFLFSEVVNSEVKITNAGDIFSTPISEHVLLFMLAFCRKMPSFILNQAQNKWERYGGYTDNKFEELHGKTLGIIGFGQIGKEVARKAKAMEMRVIATKKKLPLSAPSHIDELFPAEKLDYLLKESDFVVLTVPLTSETKGLIGQKQLGCMKRSSYLINVSRGKIIQEEELIKALEEGRIAGAALDTFLEEPLPSDSPLWQMKNVIITPHIAGASTLFQERITGVFCRNLKLFLSKRTLENIIDKNKGY